MATSMKEQDFDFKHICYTKKGQHGMESTTIMLNSKTLDNTGVGYLELKWGSVALILIS
jgi:hypothetical protein